MIAKVAAKKANRRRFNTQTPHFFVWNNVIESENLQKRKLYDEELHKKGDASTSLDAKGREVEAGWIRYVTAGSFWDETTACTTISFGKMVGSRFVPMEEIEGPTANVAQRLRKTHHFKGGERPIVRVKGGGAADVIRGYLEGYEVAV